MSVPAVAIPVRLAVVIVLCAPGIGAAANLCASPNPPIVAGSDDRRMTEETFNAKNFAAALSYFEEDLPRELREKRTTEEVRSTESFMIGYQNVITAMRGYVLRQDALLRLAERDLAMERSRRQLVSKADVAAASARFQEAKQRFCDFVKNALYSD